MKKYLGWLKRPIVWVIVVIIGVVGFFVFPRSGGENFESEILSLSDVAEVVSVSGELSPTEEVNLSFEIGGTINQISVMEGQKVSRGETLVVLDSALRQSDLLSARASLSSALAKLTEVRSGLLPAEREAALSRLRTAEVNLTNAKNKLLVSDLRAYFVGTPFDGGGSSYDPPVITGSYIGDTMGEYRIKLYASGAQSGYSFSFTGLESGAGEATSVKPEPLGSKGLFIQFPPNFAVSGVEWLVEIPNTRSAGYVTNKQAFDQAEAAYLQARAEYDLAVSGTRDEQITVAEANVSQAEASVRSAEIAISKTRLQAPFAGIIRSLPVTVGQSVSPGQTVGYLLSDSGTHITVYVPEADVANLTEGDLAEVRLSAFPGQIFRATVTYVSPAAETRDGLAVFKTRLDFIDSDDRMRSGMTVDVDIFTDSRENVLAVPGRAIIRSEGRNFVRVVSGKEITERDVEIGLRGFDGRVEILSGLTEGDRVITFIREEDLLNNR